MRVNKKMYALNSFIINPWYFICSMVPFLLPMFKWQTSQLYCLTVVITAQIITIIPVSTSHAKTPTAASWKAVDLVYFQNFPLPADKSGYNIPDCLVALDTLPTSGFRPIPVLRCKEQIHLLRPDSVVQRWKKNQTKNGFIKMSLPEFGLTRVKAKITKITAISADKLQLHAMQNKNTDQVTGKFIRHVTNVREYRFKEKNTGRIITVNATDNHLFYVKNKHAFVPVKDISLIDQLITKTGRQIRLLCSDNRWHNCGHKTAQFVQPTPVYNLEINQRHTYFVTDTAILVHNTYLRESQSFPGEPVKAPPGLEAAIDIPGAVQEGILEDILEDIPENAPEDIPEDIPEEAPAGINKPDRRDTHRKRPKETTVDKSRYQSYKDDRLSLSDPLGLSDLLRLSDRLRLSDPPGLSDLLKRPKRISFAEFSRKTTSYKISGLSGSLARLPLVSENPYLPPALPYHDPGNVPYYLYPSYPVHNPYQSTNRFGNALRSQSRIDPKTGQSF